MVSFQNSGISVKVAPFQMRSPDSQNMTASDVVGGREIRERGKREIWDLEGSQLTFMDKLQVKMAYLWPGFAFSQFSLQYMKKNLIMSDACNAFEYLFDIFIFVFIVCGRHLPLCLTDKEDMCSSTRIWYASNTIILILVIDNSRHGKLLKCNDPG